MFCVPLTHARTHTRAHSSAYYPLPPGLSQCFVTVPSVTISFPFIPDKPVEDGCMGACTHVHALSFDSAEISSVYVS